MENDLISREVAIDGVIKSCLGVSNVVIVEANAIQYIKRIPSAQPERIRGYWKPYTMSEITGYD